MVTGMMTETKMMIMKNMMSTTTTKTIFKVNCPDGLVAQPAFLQNLPDKDTKVQCLNRPEQGKQAFQFSCIIFFVSSFIRSDYTGT